MAFFLFVEPYSIYPIILHPEWGLFCLTQLLFTIQKCWTEVLGFEMGKQGQRIFWVNGEGDWWSKRSHTAEPGSCCISKNDGSQERGDRYSWREGWRSKREVEKVLCIKETGSLTVEYNIWVMESHIYCAIDCENSANTRIEWTTGNWPLSFIWVFRVAEVCFWLISVLFYFTP